MFQNLIAVPNYLAVLKEPRVQGDENVDKKDHGKYYVQVLVPVNVGERFVERDDQRDQVEIDHYQQTLDYVPRLYFIYIYI